MNIKLITVVTNEMLNGRYYNRGNVNYASRIVSLPQFLQSNIILNTLLQLVITDRAF